MATETPNGTRRVVGMLMLCSILATGGCSEPPADAECPIEGTAEYTGPGFEEPQDALSWALETQPPLLTGPGDEELYQRVPRSAEWIDFEYRVAGEIHHTWEIIRQNGQWSVGARSGCLPENSL